MSNLSEGIEQNALNKYMRETAIRMIQAGKLSDKDIAEYTALTEQQIRELREDILSTQ